MLLEFKTRFYTPSGNRFAAAILLAYATLGVVSVQERDADMTTGPCDTSLRLRRLFGSVFALLRRCHPGVEIIESATLSQQAAS